MTTTPQERHIHQGRNIKRFREMLGIKQEALAQELGEDWTQKKVSLLEAKETIDAALLDQVAGILKVPAEAFENFDEDFAVNFIANTFSDNTNSAVGYIANYAPTYNPMDKVVELYERLLQSEKEKVEMLERLLQDKK